VPGMPLRLLPFHRAWMDEREIQGVADVLTSGRVATGSRTREFERAFAEYVGARHAVAVSSGAAGLQLALEVLGVGRGDEIITSVYAFTTTAAVIVELDAWPVLVDVRADTFSIDPRLIEARVTPRTRAILPIHITGAPCEMEEILAVASRHSLRVVEDASHALPARCQGRMIGSIGDATVFNFGEQRSLTTGEGGMVSTDHADLAARLRRRRTYGVVPSAAANADAVHTMSDINAAVGIAQLRKVATFHGIRSYYATLYSVGLGDVPEIRLPEARPGDDHAWYCYTIRLDIEKLRIDRDRFIAMLREENIEASVELVPLALRPSYRRAFGYRTQDYPAAVETYRRAVSLPLYPRMREADVWDVIRAVRAVVERLRGRSRRRGEGGEPARAARPLRPTR
jgi:dTDP-4-amino-4,6-dideoxygalactose transaminase